MENKNQRENLCPRIGEVYMMYFNGDGCAQDGWRPGVVFQNNVGNEYSPNIIALPLTSSIKKTTQPTHVILRASDTSLQRDSMVLCENPERMPKERVGRFITTLSNAYMKEIACANLLATSAVSFLDAQTLLSVFNRASKLNAVRATV